MGQIVVRKWETNNAMADSTHSILFASVGFRESSMMKLGCASKTETLRRIAERFRVNSINVDAIKAWLRLHVILAYNKNPH